MKLKKAKGEIPFQYMDYKKLNKYFVGRLNLNLMIHPHVYDWYENTQEKCIVQFLQKNTFDKGFKLF